MTKKPAYQPSVPFATRPFTRPASISISESNMKVKNHTNVRYAKWDLSPKTTWKIINGSINIPEPDPSNVNYATKLI